MEHERNALAILEAIRRLTDPLLADTFERLARYSAWWKDVPRPGRDPNYGPRQFAGMEVVA